MEHETGAVAPFEKNLEVWRQLWRVVERSDLLVQIVDSRNPLLFHCPDVDVYVKEVHPCKQSVLIVNKADLIPEYVRVQWGRYFDSIHLPFVFFSAKASSQVIDQELEKKENQAGDSGKGDEAEEAEKEEEKEEEEEEKPTWRTRNAFAGLEFDDSSDDSSDESSEEETDSEANDQAAEAEPAEPTSQPSTEPSDKPSAEPSAEPSIASDIRNYATDDILEPSAEPSAEPSTEPSSEPSGEPSASELFGPADASALESLRCTAEEQQRYRIHSREEVLAFLEKRTQEAFEAVKAYDLAHPSGSASPDFAERRAVVGMIGFPNVGKSSLINVLLGVSATSHGAVRVAVGATPGKTKHLQTVVLSDSLLLCDCPGLVFPVFMNTKADLLFNGVLPASNMRDYISRRLQQTIYPRPHSPRLPARGARRARARLPHQAGPPPARPAQRRAPPAPAPRGGLQAARVHGLQPQRRERAARSHRDSQGRPQRRAALVDSAAQSRRHSAEPRRLLRRARGGHGPQRDER